MPLGPVDAVSLGVIYGIYLAVRYLYLTTRYRTCGVGRRFVSSPFGPVHTQYVECVPSICQPIYTVDGRPSGKETSDIRVGGYGHRKMPGGITSVGDLSTCVGR